MREALLIVDFQNDFTPPDGALAVPGGDQIADRLNALADSGRFELVVATRDWHPPDHASFEQSGGIWPEHCVGGTHGAELHQGLSLHGVDVVVDKGQDPNTPGYSAFEREELAELLRERQIERLIVVGLATDYCVRATALDALNRGFDVEIVREATRGVDRDDSERALAEIEQAGGRVG